MSVSRHYLVVHSLGTRCPPTPLTDLFKSYRNAKSGDKIVLRATEHNIESDVRARTTKTGNTIVSVSPRRGYLSIVEVTSKRKLDRF